MKNIFSNFGTKKVAGVVLAGATLLVGLGVVSNFSDNGQKAANEAALARFGNSSYNSFMGGGSSRADLERQMSAGQDGYSARFLKGKSDGTDADEAFSSDGAYAEGMRGDGSYGPGGAYGVNGSGSGADNGVYQSIDSTYQQVVGGQEFEGDNGKGSGAYGEAKFQAAQNAAAAAAAKGVKGNAAKGGKGTNGQAAGGRGIRQGTQMNKLAASSGGSSFGKGGGGSSSGFDGGSASLGGSTGGDNNTRALPQTDVKGGTGDSNAFKFGRAGGIGGFDTGFNGKEAKGGNSHSSGAAGDLQLATAYSVKGAGSKQAVDQKSLAEAAFDGSNPEDIATTIPDNATIDQVSSALMGGMDIDLPDGGSIIPPEVEDDLKEVAKQQTELAKLQQKLSSKLLWMIGTVAVMAIALFFLVKAAYAAPAAWWFWVAAGALSLIALGTIALFMWAGEDSIVNLIKQMGDEEKFGLVNQGVDVGGKLTQAGITAASLAALLGLCWIPWNSVAGLSKIVQSLIGSVASGIVGKVVQSATTEAQNLSNAKKQNKG